MPETKTEPQTASAKFSDKPTIQTSDRPVVNFNELKIKSQFLLQNNLQKTQPLATETTAPSSQIPLTVDDVELTSERVNEAIRTYADTKSKNGNKQLYATLTSSKINLINTSIVIELNNEVQKEMLTAIKQDMLDELRSILSNKQAQLEIKVSEITSEIKAYKPADKFKLMAEKNPALLELKKRFDLDIEY